jgi:hypothetical protein
MGALTKQSPWEVVFESTIFTDAIWHIIVLLALTALYLIMVSMGETYWMATLIFIVIVCLLVLILVAFTKSHHMSALRSLCCAFVSGRCDKMQQALWHVEAAIGSAQDIASMEELMTALSKKLSLNISSVSDDVHEPSTLLRQQVLKMFFDKVSSASRRLWDAIQGQRQHKQWQWDGESLPSQQAVGMTAEEIAFAEQVLTSFEQESTQLQVLVEEPLAASSDLRAQDEDPLHQLHRAMAAGDVVWLHEAISVAQTANVSPEELTLAEAVLSIEEARFQRSSLHGLRQARDQLTVASTSADAARKLRIALRSAKLAGVDEHELHGAETLLQSVEANFAPPVQAKPVLKSPGAGLGERPLCPTRKKKVVFADESFGLDNDEAKGTSLCLYP